MVKSVIAVLPQVPSRKHNKFATEKASWLLAKV